MPQLRTRIVVRFRIRWPETGGNQAAGIRVLENSGRPSVDSMLNSPARFRQFLQIGGDGPIGDATGTAPPRRPWDTREVPARRPRRNLPSAVAGETPRTGALRGR